MRVFVQGAVWELTVDGLTERDVAYNSSHLALESAMDHIFEHDRCGQETNRWLTAPKPSRNHMLYTDIWYVDTIEGNRVIHWHVIQIRRITVLSKPKF